MAKEVKSTIQLTDKFLIHRENTEDGAVMKTVDGSDVQSFIEDSQSKFTDQIEQDLASLQTTVQNNTDTISENQLENEKAHTQFESDISSNTNIAVQNSAEISTTKRRVTKLESDDRTFGYYTLFWIGPSASDPEPDEGAFIPLDDNDNLERSDYANVTKLRFNRTDILGVKRSFLALFSGDVVEIACITNAIPDFLQHAIESRATFRVTDDYDPTSQYPNGIDDPKVTFIDVNVELVNGIGQNYDVVPDPTNPNDVYVGFPFKLELKQYNHVDEINEYVRCGVYPSVNIEEAVSLDTLKKSLAPIGTIVLWASNNIPEGWLRCDGRNLSQAQSGRTQEEKDDIKLLFDQMNISKLPPIAGRFVAGAKGNYENTRVHSFDLGTVYNRQTGLPTDSNGAILDLTVSNAGEHNHNANMTSNGRHSHKYGSNDQSASGNKTNVYDARNRKGSFETDTAGEHNHTATIKDAGKHQHEVKGFNSDNRPHTVALHYIIKYRHVLDD